MLTVILHSAQEGQSALETESLAVCTPGHSGTPGLSQLAVGRLCALVTPGVGLAREEITGPYGVFFISPTVELHIPDFF